MKRYQKALVLGAGRSGEAAARLLREEGTAVTVVDAANDLALQRRAARLGDPGTRILLGTRNLPWDVFDVCVVSPGIPGASAWVAEMRRRGVEVIGELELGWSRCGSRVLAVTGSNGKSTLVKWLAESLAAAGLRAAPAGNYGPPLSEVVSQQPGLDWVVVEVSSFQLETVRAFRPHVGVLLNCYPNHLERHGNAAEYLRVKARLFARTTASDVCIVPGGLLEEVRRSAKGGGAWRTFGVSESDDYRYRAGRVEQAGASLASFDGTRFANEVFGASAAAGVAAVEAAGVSVEHAVQAARNFRPLPHRLERLATVCGVTFVNDSKATNLAAMAAALRATPGPVRLLAGGLAKESDFGVMKELLAERVSGVYLMGQSAEDMMKAWSEVVPCALCGTLPRAFDQASKEASAGETVLLSPGAASFDQFRNFEERGDVFREQVAQRAANKEKCVGIP